MAVQKQYLTAHLTVEVTYLFTNDSWESFFKGDHHFFLFLSSRLSPQTDICNHMLAYQFLDDTEVTWTKGIIDKLAICQIGPRQIGPQNKITWSNRPPIK